MAFTGYTSAPTIEMTWALILAASRHVVAENLAFRRGGWQQGVGVGLAGKTLGVLGLGRVGGAVAEVGALFGMKRAHVEPEHDARARRRARRDGGQQGGAAAPLRRADHPHGAEPEDARPASAPTISR